MSTTTSNGSTKTEPAWKKVHRDMLDAQERRRQEEQSAKAKKISELRASSSIGDGDALATLSASPTMPISVASSMSSSPPASSSSSLASSPSSSASSLSAAMANPSASTKKDGSTPKWKVLQAARLEFEANLKKREQEAKMKKLADLGLLVKPSIGAEQPEGIPNPNAVSSEGVSLRHSHLTHDSSVGLMKVTVDEITDSDTDNDHNKHTTTDTNAADTTSAPHDADASSSSSAAASAEALALAEQAAAAAQFAAFAAQQAAAARAQQAAYRAAMPFPSDIGHDIDDVRAHVMRLLQPVGMINGQPVDGFDLEYEYLSERQLQATSPSYVAALAEVNLSKNRYTARADDAHSDYINANFVRARSDMPVRYISCQGPLESTSADMWRMVWERNSSVIVMLTREVEKGFVKCDRYWPDPSTPGMLDDDGRCRAQYGDLAVAFVDEAAGDEFVVRRFDVAPVADPSVEPRRITQFMYSGWPDHGIPASRGGFLQMCALADAANVKTASSPFIVHCSAGVGRTGTFCAVHGALERFMADLTTGKKPLVNILESVREMREARLGMVQTKEQYVFAYLAVLEQTELWLFERGMLPDQPDDANDQQTTTTNETAPTTTTTTDAAAAAAAADTTTTTTATTTNTTTPVTADGNDGADEQETFDEAEPLPVPDVAAEQKASDAAAEAAPAATLQCVDSAVVQAANQ